MTFLGFRHTEETKQKMVKIHKDRIKSKKQLDALRKYGNKFKKGITLPIKSRKHLNLPKSELVKINMRLAQQKYFKTHPGSMKGKHHTIQARLNMRIAKRKYVLEHPEGPTKETRLKLSVARLKQKFHKKDSNPEKILQKELKQRKIKFKKHIPILGQPDIFISPNICIFIDGDYWHANPNKYNANDIVCSGSKKIKAKEKWIKDEFINLKLLIKNYKVLRFWETDINKNINSIGDRIEKEMVLGLGSG